MKATCSKCGSCEVKARGLCSHCYESVRAHGTHLDYPSIYMPARDLIEEIEWLGFDPRFPIRPQFRNLAPRLGMDYKTAERAWYRHQQKTRSAA